MVTLFVGLLYFLSNQRILSIHDDSVTCITKDYRNKAVKKPVTLDGIEFMRRFTMHIQPQRFVKFRRYDMYNPTLISNHKLQFVPEEKPDWTHRWVLHTAQSPIY